MVSGAPVPGENLVQGFGLGRVAREPVEDEAGLAVGLFDALFDEAEHDLVGHESAGVHDHFRFLAERRTVGHCFAEDIPRGDLGNLVLLNQHLRLRTFTSTGRSKQHNPLGHRDDPP